MAKECVDVSYNWGADENTPVVDALGEAIRNHGLDFRRDKEQLKYGDLIQRFMDELGSSGNVVPVFSRAYFESEYCMYELLKVWKTGNFHKRIQPVVVGDIRLDDVDTQVELIELWANRTKALRKKLKKLDPASSVPLQARSVVYADIYKNINDLMSFVADMNVLSLEALRQENFLPLLERIKPSKPGGTPPRPSRKPDSEFREQIHGEMRDLLAKAPLLADELRAQASAQGANASDDLAKALIGAGLEVALSDILHPAARKCLAKLDAGRSEFDELWSAAKSLLGWLTLLAVSNDWIEEQDDKLAASPDLAFELMVDTLCGVEIVSARFRQLAPRLDAAPGEAEVLGGDAIGFPGLPTGTGDDYALERLLLAIWRCVFPESPREALTDKDLRNLASTLKNREKNKTNHYYIPVSEGEACPLSRPDFRQKLLARLPGIPVIYLRSSGLSRALIVEDELDFMAIIREFLSIPHNLRK